MSDAAGNSFVIDFPGKSSINFHPTGINNLAQVVGWADNGSAPRTQFLRDSSGQFNFFEPAGPNGTTIDEGRAINDLGQETGIYNDGAITKGFSTGPVFVEQFASFPVTLTDITPSTGGMTVWGSFTPCSGRAVSPTGSPLILKLYQPGVAWASVAIPAGYFLGQTGAFEYHATHHGMTIDAYIWGPLSDGHFDFRVYATGVKGLPKAGAATVSLAVGDNMGTATINSPTYH
jgi:hypothetical protein